MRESLTTGGMETDRQHTIVADYNNILRMYVWCSLLAPHVRVTTGDRVLCGYVCVRSFEL